MENFEFLKAEADSSLVPNLPTTIEFSLGILVFFKYLSSV